MSTTPAPTSRAARPLSPHLQVYRFQITSVLSICHRFSGMALTFGTPVLALWLWSAAYSPECFAWLSRQCAAWYGQVALIGWSFAFFYHLANGIRHLFWDIGKGFALTTVTRTGVAAVLFAVILTTLTWWCVYERMESTDAGATAEAPAAGANE